VIEFTPEVTERIVGALPGAWSLQTGADAPATPPPHCSVQKKPTKISR